MLARAFKLFFSIDPTHATAAAAAKQGFASLPAPSDPQHATAAAVVATLLQRHEQSGGNHRYFNLSFQDFQLVYADPPGPAQLSKAYCCTKSSQYTCNLN